MFVSAYGAPRSGTNLLSRLLNSAGCPQGRMPTDTSAPKPLPWFEPKHCAPDILDGQKGVAIIKNPFAWQVSIGKWEPLTIKYWLWVNREYLKYERKHPDKFKVITYDDLMTKTEETISEVEKFIGSEIKERPGGATLFPGGKTTGVSFDTSYYRDEVWRDELFIDEIRAGNNALADSEIACLFPDIGRVTDPGAVKLFSKGGLGDQIQMSWLQAGLREAGHNVIAHVRDASVGRLFDRPWRMASTDKAELKKYIYPYPWHNKRGQKTSYGRDVLPEQRFKNRVYYWRDSLPAPYNEFEPMRCSFANPFEEMPSLRGKVLLFPFSEPLDRTWSKFPALAEELSEKGIEYEVMIAGGDRDRKKGAIARMEKIKPCLSLPLHQLPSAMREASVVVCNDSMALHLAGIVGVATLCVSAQVSPLTISSLYQNVLNIEPNKIEHPCTNCHATHPKFHKVCSPRGCEALNSLEPSTVIPFLLRNRKLREIQNL